MPDCFIIAGPNGAGKTTFAREFLPKYAGCMNFINPDLLAAGLSPFDASRAMKKAGRLVIEEIRDRVEKGESFGNGSMPFTSSITPQRNRDSYSVRWRANLPSMILPGMRR